MCKTCGKDELSQLAKKYGTDKWGKHHYTPVYYDLFKDKRNEVKKVLEIGPAEGAGLFMFRDFFPNAIIYGAEIDEHRVNKLRGLDRIVPFGCDQSKQKDLMMIYQRFGVDFDLIIDDGSHKPSDQATSCWSLYNFLAEGGYYIIEDVANAKVVMERLNPLNPELKRVGDRYDDQLIIIKK